MSRELYVRRLPVTIDEEGVRRLFAVAGKVSFVHMVKDARSGEFRGTVFVKMSTDAEVKEAVDLLDGARIDNHEISVAIALPQQQRDESTKAPRKPGGGRSGPARGKRR